MFRSILMLAATLALVSSASAQVVTSPDRTADQQHAGFRGLQITLEARTIVIDDHVIPASIQLPNLGSCKVVDPQEIALLLSTAEFHPRGDVSAPQKLTVQNGEHGELTLDANCGATFSPVVSDSQRAIRLGLRVHGGAGGKDGLPTMNSEVPVGKPLLAHVTLVSENRRPSLWERVFSGKTEEKYIEHKLLIVTPQIGGQERNGSAIVK